MQRALGWGFNFFTFKKGHIAELPASQKKMAAQFRYQRKKFPILLLSGKHDSVETRWKNILKEIIVIACLQGSEESVNYLSNSQQS